MWSGGFVSVWLFPWNKNIWTEMGNKEYTELLLERCFLWGLGWDSTMPAECLSWPLLIGPSQLRYWPNNQGSHEFSLRFFFKEAFTGMPQGPKDTWGSLNFLPQYRMCMQLSHLWPGKKRLCVYFLLWPAGPTGKPSFTATQVSVRK